MDQVNLVDCVLQPCLRKSVFPSCLTFSQFCHSASFSNCAVYGATDLLPLPRLTHHHHLLPFSETIPRLRETQLCRATEITPAKSMTVTLHIHQPTDPRRAYSSAVNTNSLQRRGEMRGLSQGRGRGYEPCCELAGRGLMVEEASLSAEGHRPDLLCGANRPDEVSFTR